MSLRIFRTPVSRFAASIQFAIGQTTHRFKPTVGPIAFDGAEPGDTLVVHVLRVRPNRGTPVSTQGGTFGALAPDGG